MNEGFRKLQHRTEEQSEQQTHAAQQQQQQQAAQEFASVDELIRHDASQTQVPPAIETRLQQSARSEPPPKRWWQRLLGR